MDNTPFGSKYLKSPVLNDYWIRLKYLKWIVNNYPIFSFIDWYTNILGLIKVNNRTGVLINWCLYKKLIYIDIYIKHIYYITFGIFFNYKFKNIPPTIVKTKLRAIYVVYFLNFG